MQCPSDESLMDNAKESGQKMYAYLGTEEKKEKINLMVSFLSVSLFYKKNKLTIHLADGRTEEDPRLVHLRAHGANQKAELGGIGS